MKKVLLTTCILLSFLISRSQLCFIGQTKEQVKKYWSTKVSSDYFTEGEYDNDSTGQSFFTIRTPYGSDVFSAYYDKTGKCIEHESAFTGETLNRYVSVLNQNKNLKRDEKNDRWVYSLKKCFFKINNSLGTDNFYIVCSKL